MAIRITGGWLRGRILHVPLRGVRPTQDRVRETLFNIVAAVVPGARVLDLFAGSGALGLEAWSRGAASVTWVEKERKTYVLLQQNLEDLCGKKNSNTACVRADVSVWLARTRNVEWDLILADPPYREACLSCIMDAIERNSLLAEKGLLVYEQSASASVMQRSGWHIARDRTLGDTRLVIYNRE